MPVKNGIAIALLLRADSIQYILCQPFLQVRLGRALSYILCYSCYIFKKFDPRRVLYMRVCIVLQRIFSREDGQGVVRGVFGKLCSREWRKNCGNGARIVLRRRVEPSSRC